MTNDKELSDLKIERKECPKCGATWINGVHRWSTGAMGSELDLAGLVCNTLGNVDCVNPIRGIEGGDTWERRFSDINQLEDKARKDAETE
jgi:hypothetical protein